MFILFLDRHLLKGMASRQYKEGSRRAMPRCSGDVKQAAVDVHRLNAKKKKASNNRQADPILAPHVFASFIGNEGGERDS
jgi:hypothetical protein